MVGRAGLVAARDHMLYPIPDKAAPTHRKKKKRTEDKLWDGQLSLDLEV